MQTATPREARVGDRLPTSVLGPRATRRLDATALLIPGSGDLADYRAALESAREGLRAWDGVVVVAEPDGSPLHRLLIVDRYRQVYAVHEAPEPDGLPGAADVAEWFRFLATACPECGVLDDPVRAGPTP